MFSVSLRALLALAGLVVALPCVAQTCASGTLRPYDGAPVNGVPIPIASSGSSVFEAENFNCGGQEVAYHDNVAGNAGGQYRTAEDVDIIVSSDPAGGGYVVENFETGEWLTYSIDVAASGTYTVAIKAANHLTPGAFHIEVDGVNVTGSVTVPVGQSWSDFQWASASNVGLPAGQHVLKLVSDQQYFNVNQLQLTFVSSTVNCPSGPLRPYAGSPVNGNPISIAATGSTVFEAENFNCGGQDVAYHDNVAGNSGGQYRPGEDVDLIVSSDPSGGGYVVNNFETGEWLTYNISVQADGLYNVDIRAANNLAPAAFHVEIDGTDVTGAVSVPVTGSWSTFNWYGASGVSLTAGQHVLKLVVNQQYFDVNQLRLTFVSAPQSCGAPPLRPYSTAPAGGFTIAASGTTAIQAEDFDCGGEGLAYHDNVAGNSGGQYRTDENVDIVAGGAGFVVNNFETGEWLVYTINVGAAGDYTFGVRASNNLSPASFHIEVDGTSLGTVAVPLTGSWTTFQDFMGTTAANLTVGSHTVKLFVDLQYFNADALLVAAGTTTGGGGGTGPQGMLFWSGFEPGTMLGDPTRCYGNGCFQDISGTDTSTGFSWPISLKGGTTEFQLLTDTHGNPAPTPSTVGQWMFNEVRTVTGHKGTSTNVLYSEVLKSGCCGTGPQGGGATQDAMHVEPAAEPGDIYFSKWLFLDPQNLAQNFTGFRVVFEWKEGGGLITNVGAASRIVLGLVPLNGQPSWQVQWDEDANGTDANGNALGCCTEAQKHYRRPGDPNANPQFDPAPINVPVPVGEWFKLEVFWHRSSGSDGRAWFAVNGQVLDDHCEPNIGASGTPIGRIFANQVYTGGPYPVSQMMDDVQIWDRVPPACTEGDPATPWCNPPYATVTACQHYPDP